MYAVSYAYLITKIKINRSGLKGVKTGIYYNSQFYPEEVNITELNPNTTYEYALGFQLANGNFCRNSDLEITTRSMKPKIQAGAVTPLSFSCTGSYDCGDAEVIETGFTGYETDGKSLELTGLTPETKYSVEYYVKTKEGYQESVTRTFTTPTVTFTTLPAKATSNTVAVICAETNLTDDTVGAGFEWRRYDAPDLVPSTQSECPVIDGALTGALRNLSAGTYYKFRPYYTSTTGKTYYGEWSAFGTADAYVYFDPTVRTYSAINVTSSSAQVKGYAISGSDDIVEQGFEYWATNGTTHSLKALANEGVQSVVVNGQYMTTTLQNLSPSTEYIYRAYVKTAKGVIYGSEESFCTEEDPTGIEEIPNAGISVFAQHGKIVVNGIDTPVTIEVYLLNGQLLYRGNDTIIPIALERGLYLVRVGNSVVKVRL